MSSDLSVRVTEGWMESGPGGGGRGGRDSPGSHLQQWVTGQCQQAGVEGCREASAPAGPRELGPADALDREEEPRGGGRVWLGAGGREVRAGLFGVGGLIPKCRRHGGCGPDKSEVRWSSGLETGGASILGLQMVLEQWECLGPLGEEKSPEHLARGPRV